MGYTTTDESEAAHLCEIGDEYSREDWEADVMCELSDDRKAYRKNKKAKVGDKVACAGPICNRRFVKKTPQQKFCCIRCKDQYHNRQRYWNN